MVQEANYFSGIFFAIKEKASC